MHFEFRNATSTSLIEPSIKLMAPKRLKTPENSRSSTKRSADSPISPVTSVSDPPLTSSSSTATLDYVSPPLVPQMARRLKVSPDRIPSSRLSIQVPPLPLHSVEDLFGPDDDESTPRTPIPSSATFQPMSSPTASSVSGTPPSFSPGPFFPSPAPSTTSVREQELEHELHRMQDFNQRLQDDVVRLSNLMATTTIEIRICGSPTKRGLPCKNRRGTCPFHSPSGTPKAGCQHFRTSATSSPLSADHSVEQWQI